MSFWIRKSSRGWSRFWCKRSGPKETERSLRDPRFACPSRCSLKSARTRVSSTSKSSRVSCWQKRQTTSDSKATSSLPIRHVQPISIKLTSVCSKNTIALTAIWVQRLNRNWSILSWMSTSESSTHTPFWQWNRSDSSQWFATTRSMNSHFCTTCSRGVTLHLNFWGTTSVTTSLRKEVNWCKTRSWRMRT